MLEWVFDLWGFFKPFLVLVGAWFVERWKNLMELSGFKCQYWGIKTDFGVKLRYCTKKTYSKLNKSHPISPPPIKFPDSFRRDDVPMKWERKKALVLLMAPSETWNKHLPSSLNCTFSNILQNIAKQRLSTFWCLASLYFCDCWSNMKGKGGKQFRALLTMKEHRRRMDTRLFSNSLPPTTSLLKLKVDF